MAERDPSELDLAAAFRSYLEDAPTQARPAELAHRFATAYPHGRGALARWGFGMAPSMAWVLLLAGLLLALVVGGIAAGVWRPDLAVVIASSPTPTATATATPAPTMPVAPMGPMITDRSRHTATLLADGRVLIAGGIVVLGNSTATAEIYDPKTGAFSPTGSMTTARQGATATLLADGRVLVAGGGNDDPAVLATAEVYDPKTGAFSRTGSMATARQAATATLLADGRVLVAGGVGVTGSVPEIYPPTAEAEVYDPTTGIFSPTGSMAAARSYHTATLLPDGRVLVVGGSRETVADWYFLATAEIYDPTTGTFSPTGSMTTVRSHHTATLLPDGRVLVAGGNYESTTRSGALASVEIYEPKTGAFRTTGPMTTEREFHTATLLADGTVLFAGGFGFTAEIYDPKTAISSRTNQMAAVRTFNTATLLTDGRVLVAGGGTSEPYPGPSAELYDPKTESFGPTGP